jgi:hypothetical protein
MGIGVIRPHVGVARQTRGSPPSRGRCAEKDAQASQRSTDGWRAGAGSGRMWILGLALPFIFTMAEQGRVGKIAELDVDVRLGGISFSEGDFIRIAGEAQRLVQDQETF